MTRTDFMRFCAAGLFVFLIMLVVSSRVETGGGGSLLVIAAMIGGYMAMNIGANDGAAAGGDHDPGVFGLSAAERPEENLAG